MTEKDAAAIYIYSRS